MTDLEMQELIRLYNSVVIEYESLDHKIFGLLSAYRGATENMPEKDFEIYRNLAFRRDELLEKIQFLAKSLGVSQDDID
ncbi:hypothetical protein MASR2M15_04630 [Anaerolineales bacterium]